MKFRRQARFFCFEGGIWRQRNKPRWKYTHLSGEERVCIVNVMILERKDWWKLSREINTRNHLLKQSPKLTRGWRRKIPRILSEYCAGCSAWCRHEKENPFRGREVSSMTSWKRWCSLRSRSSSFASQAQLPSCRSHMTTPSGAQWIMTENTKPLPGREMLSSQI